MEYTQNRYNEALLRERREEALLHDRSEEALLHDRSDETKLCDSRNLEQQLLTTICRICIVESKIQKFKKIAQNLRKLCR